MDDDERLDVRVDGLGIGRDLAQRVVGAQLAERGPAAILLLSALHHHHGILRGAEDGQGAEDADDGLLGPGDAGHEARDVVLERLLEARAEAGDGGLGIAADGDEAEVDRRAERVGLLRLDAVALRPLLGVGVRLGVVLLEADAALAGDLVFAQQVADLPGVRLKPHGHVLGAFAEEELQRDVAFELAEELPGPLGEGEEALLGEVEAQTQVGGDHDEGADDDEQDGESRDAGAEVLEGLGGGNGFHI